MLSALYRRAVPLLAFLAAPLFCQTPVAAPPAELKSNPCPDSGPAITLNGSVWNGWGRDLDNSHYQPEPGFQLADVSKLKPKWAFAYPGGRANGQPTIVGGRVFVTSESGHVYALNARTGCTYWAFESPAPARTAVTIAALPGSSPVRYAAYFGDEKAAVYALDAASGKQIWKTQVDEHPIARITGAPVFFRDRLYVPVASIEEFSAAMAKYECCTFRGSMVALDGAAGKLLWKTYVIPDAPQPLRKSTVGTQLYGPAGGGIWSAPTIDPARNLVYAGTGDSYTDAETKMTDAVVAFDLAKGAIQWANQITPNDNFIICSKPGEANCPKNLGPDFDFGSSVILRKLPGGRSVLLAGQKSGVIMALDPEARGKLLWQAKVGQGSTLGGIEWGFAADDRTVYVPVSDVNSKPEGKPGLTALAIDTGKQLWHVPAPDVPCSWNPRSCSHSQSAAITVVPGVIFSGTMDGHLRAYAAEDGKILWDFDTAAKTWDAVNGIPARGSVIDVGAPTVAGGMLFLNSGYGRIPGQPGNLLMAFSVDGK